MAVVVQQSVRAGTPSRLWRIRNALSPQEWTRALAMIGVVVALHVIGWVTLIAVVAPHHYTFGSENQVFGVGLGVTAYTLGMRHAFDADHIAAIDNTTRKLMAEGQRPTVGRLLVLPRPFVGRLRARFLFSVGRQGARSRQVSDDSFGAASHHRRGSARRSPASSSCSSPGHQPGHPAGHPEGLPGDARGLLRRGRARSPAQQRAA